MATRRIVASEKTVLEKDDHIGASPAAGEKSDTTPAVPFDVIMKLLAFTFAMIVVPIGSYFATVNNVFKGGFFSACPQAQTGFRRGSLWHAPLLTRSSIHRPFGLWYRGQVTLLMLELWLLSWRTWS
ncbi:hypothetical protein RB595_008500 [Gaeumannomyces hyphopodioides]